MIASRTALLLAIHLLFSPATSQKLLSLDCKYSRTKYNEHKRNGQYQNSFSYQFLIGMAKEVKDGLRLGIKAGFTIDQIFSDFFGRNIQNFSRNNVLAYAGVNIQKRLLADPKEVVALWIQQN